MALLSSRFRPCLAVLVLTALSGAAVAVGPPVPSTEATLLRLVWEQPLSGVLGSGLDVRWAGEDSVFVAAGRRGVFEVPVGGDGGLPRTVVPGEDSEEGFFFSSRLGRSAKYLVAGSSFQAFVWRRLPSPATLSPQVAFSATMDLDVSGNQVAVLGATRDGQGGWSGDDIVWLGRLGAGDVSLEPFFPALEEGGTTQMAKTFFLELGALRFLVDGSLLVVPGIEPGAYLFGPDRKLRQTWTTEGLGLPTDLRFDEEQRQLLARDPSARERWVNRHRVLDEILPLPSGPALVIRHVEGGETRWDLARLAADGSLAVEPLPVRSPSIQTHLRGDVRGGQVVLLTLEYTGPYQTPKVPRRLLVLETAPETHPNPRPELAAAATLPDS